MLLGGQPGVPDPEGVKVGREGAFTEAGHPPDGRDRVEPPGKTEGWASWQEQGQES